MNDDDKSAPRGSAAAPHLGAMDAPVRSVNAVAVAALNTVAFLGAGAALLLAGAGGGLAFLGGCLSGLAAIAVLFVAEHRHGAGAAVIG